MNQSKSFTVKWIDNNSAKRPSLSASNFKLSYTNDGGKTWKVVDGAALDELGIKKAPTLTVVDREKGQYKFTGLPTVDVDGNTLEFKVESETAPDGYSCEAGDDIFTFRENTDFSAKIVWLDDSDAAKLRPEKVDTLKLYRRIDGGLYEEVTSDNSFGGFSGNVAACIKNPGGNEWSVDLSGLPRYDDNNYEYDYVLIQGNITTDGEDKTKQVYNGSNIDTAETGSSYVPYYNNGSSNHGNDVELCHNGGEIKEKLEAVTEFTATKVWKDEEKTGRPTATVTLWRYPLEDGADNGIDATYASGKAAQVIYGNNVVLSYTLSGATKETIKFDSTTVNGLPNNFTLPKYDEQGRKYVYFVRETLGSDNYDITYADSKGQALNQGAASGGTISNVLKERAKVTITKKWQCPSNLGDIDGVSVRLKISVTDSEGAEQELTLLSSKTGSYDALSAEEKDDVLLIDGFTPAIWSLSSEFYVNVRDSYGVPYDMSKLKIVEAQIKDKDGKIIGRDIEEDGTFDLKEHKYKAAAKYEEDKSDSDAEYEQKYFTYLATNTITGERDYKIKKVWADVITDDQLKNVASVSFSLLRKSDAPESNWETVKNPGSTDDSWVIEKANGRTWEKSISEFDQKLDEYDEYGYKYEYKAVETNVTFIDGSQKPENWTASYVRTENETTVTNGTTGGSDRSVTISKVWDDNGDISMRKPVKIRVYRKADVIAALAKLDSSVHTGDAESLLEGVVYNEYTLTAEWMWYQDIGIKGIENSLRAKDDNEEKVEKFPVISNYIFIEYAVGDDKVIYNVSDLKATAEAEKGYSSYKGEITNSSNRQYDVTAELGTDEEDVTFTNTRTGQSFIVVNKRWKDETADTRPNTISFRILRDGELYTDLTDDNINKTKTEGDINISVSEDSGIVTVTRKSIDNDDDWSFALKGLELFAPSGAIYSYDVEEVLPEGCKYESAKDIVKIDEDENIADNVTYTYGFTNTLNDTVSHVAYKDWRDAATGGADRPDLYMTLYRYLKHDKEENPGKSIEELYSYVKYDAYKDQTWTPNTDGETIPAGTGSGYSYDWKITVDNLPRYDENGREYIYVFSESMNNNGVNVYGTYEKTAATYTNENGLTYEYFVNTITGKMSVSGDKVWVGFTGYSISESDYPDVTIELYRTLKSNIDLLDEDIDKSKVDELIKDKTIEYVDKTTITDDKYKFAFDGTYDKFDADGNRYIYLYREVIDGIAGSLYTKQSVSGTLTNTFRDDVNRRIIKVTKAWDRQDLSEEESDKYPSVTYELYRYVYNEEASDKGAGTAVKYRTLTINASEFQNNPEYTATFADLLVYSPKGELYGYYVKEKSINGYETAYTDGTKSADTGSDWCDVNTESPPITKKDETEVGVKNTYKDEKNITISGDKYWNDYGNSELIYGGRPDLGAINITLTRYTYDETNQNNKVNSEEVGIGVKEKVDTGYTKPYIVWSQDKNDSNRWHYDIYNLERYAPNGMPYIYSVQEEQTEGYKKISAVTGQLGDKSDKIDMSLMTNSFDGEFTVKKTWHDGYDKYGLRPKSVTIILQRRVKGSSNDWEYIGWDSSISLPHADGIKRDITVDGSVKKMDVVSVKLTSDYVLENTKGSSWGYTFKNLPTKNAAGNDLEYRCIEAQIDGIDFSEATDKLGAYTRAYSNSGTRTDIANELDSTSLVVTKSWVGDKDNQYNSRPDSVTMKLQKKNQYDKWVDVTIDDKGTVYTFSLTSKNDWTVTLVDLPVAEVDEKGEKFYGVYFRAVELHADEDELTVQGAKNYKDTTDYDNYGSDAGGNHYNHYYDETDKCNISNIENTLITDESLDTVTVKKVWHKYSDASKTATFELKYKTESEKEWHSYTNAKGGRLTQTISSGEESQEVTWTNLPMYDLAGNKLVYKVVEDSISGYTTETTDNSDDGRLYATDYIFTNIELQSYTVHKTWQTTDYAEKTADGYKALFKLQKKVGEDGDWEDVKDSKGNLYEKTLNIKTFSDAAMDTSAKWDNLPMYTVKGEKITYRAVETKINDKFVSFSDDGTCNDTTNGAYKVTYTYGDSRYENPAFADKDTYATNRMIYGFVNLSKKAAYLAPSVTSAEGKKLSGVEFDIYKGTTKHAANLYVSGVKTDDSGNLINTGGKYGTEGKYLVAGTYTIYESKALADCSAWESGVTFHVGVEQDVNYPDEGYTGEHGTAWICTDTSLDKIVGIKLVVSYVNSKRDLAHTYDDKCEPETDIKVAYNIESRGVIEFKKTDASNALVDTHEKATGESKAYFGVYIDDECETQVAGMEAVADATGADTAAMKLTTKDESGTDASAAFMNVKNASGIPYLRSSGGELTLLSGTYYIKELRAPAGYKLDTTVRKAVVDKIASVNADGTTDLSGIYTANKAKISLTSEANGVTDYKWNNNPNVVKLYKRDQYGRVVALGDNGYLELKTEDTGVTFLTGENAIRLYQSKTAPTKDSNGTDFDADCKPDIIYDEKTGCWTITGLFDAGKKYSLTEPTASVPAENIIADGMTFVMRADGAIESVTSGASDKPLTQVDNPTAANGSNYDNAYKSSATVNVVVMRDVARFRKSIILNKKDSSTGKPIADISFKLYKYEGSKDAVTKKTSVLEEGVYLTTDKDGVIDLSKQDVSITNLVTGCALKWGLDVGTYYFEEVERGASDSYVLAEKIYFEVMANDDDFNSSDKETYAKLEFSETAHVSQNDSETTAVVTNDPVTTEKKELLLTKKNDDGKSLSGARFKLEYTSATVMTTGSQDKVTYYCITGEAGKLYIADTADDEWTVAESESQPDISKKGSYVLTELQSPDGYRTYTKPGTSDVVSIVTFDVKDTVGICNVCAYDETSKKTIKLYDDKGEAIKSSDNVTDIVSEVSIVTGEANPGLALTLTNKKATLSIAKLDDLIDGVKSGSQKKLGGQHLAEAEIEIYEGIYQESSGEEDAGGDGNTPKWSYTSGSADEAVTYGLLKENTIYTLHEKSAPTGYLKADDIYFALFGTSEQNGSQIYVWTGTSALSEVLSSGGTWTSAMNWSKKTNIDSSGVLTMVDEVIIAPVDVQKVVETAVGATTYEALSGAKFDVYEGDSAESGTKLGTAISGSDGYLVWNSIEEDSLKKKLIYDTSGKLAVKAGDIMGKTVVLKQNSVGYTFKEVEAPDIAYNDGGSYTVKITDANYLEYRTFSDGKVSYNEKYIDIKKAAESAGHTVDSLTTRHNDDKTALVNPHFEAKFVLDKYDADYGDGSKMIAGTEFTLYKLVNNKYTMMSTVTTDEDGRLTVPITEKGSYKLAETKATDGYKISSEYITFDIVNEDYKKTFTYHEGKKIVYKSAGDAQAGDSANGSPPSGGSQEETVNNVYRYANHRKLADLEILKKGSDNNAEVTALDGVQLSIQYYDEAVKAYRYVKLTNGSASVSSYKPTTTTDESEAVVTVSSGKAVFGGLPNGKYKITEIKTAAGYNLLSEPIEVNIDIVDKTQTYSSLSSLELGGDSFKWKVAADKDTLSMTIINRKGFDLPKTGSETPKLPLPVLPVEILLETAFLIMYGRRGRRRRGGGSG